MYEIWLKAQKELSSAEEENNLGNVALSPPAKYHLPLETIFRPSRGIKIFLEQHKIWLKAKKGLCEGVSFTLGDPFFGLHVE